MEFAGYVACLPDAVIIDDSPSLDPFGTTVDIQCEYNID